MPRGNNTTKNTKAASGAGTIRKKTVKRNGKEYTYWEARYTTGFDPGTGKQIQRSVTGKTQKEVAQKLRQFTAEIDHGTYIAPCKMTLGEWLDIWAGTYLNNVKPRTRDIYKSFIRLHIKPALGAVRMEELTPHMVQNFYNTLFTGSGEKPALSPKSINGIHGTLHLALNQAVLNNYIRANPTEACSPPRIEKKDLAPLNEQQIANFLTAIQGTELEDLFVVALFTGMRQGELLGLTWDCVDFVWENIVISKQMQLHQEKGINAYELVSPKNGRSRTIVPAPTVMEHLKHRRSVQALQKLAAGAAWQNPLNLVFTDALGTHLTKPTVYRAYKKVVSAIGRPDARFHDMRHSYAVAAIRSGDDIKTVQNNLGHATAAFTLDVYGHVTPQMKKESAARMERFIRAVSGQ